MHIICHKKRCLAPLLLGFIFVFLLVSSRYLLIRPPTARSLPPIWLNGSADILVEPNGFVVNTSSCQIPDFDAYNAVISQYVRDPRPQLVVCNSSLPVTFTDRQYIRLNSTLAKSLNIKKCLYQQLTWYSDNKVQYSDEVFFTEDVKVTDAEFLRVRCYGTNDQSHPVYTNFHAVAQLKPDVERRCEETRDRSSRTSSENVPNVLMVGIDSTSRLNSIRRLNSTRRFLRRQLHALELHGYSRVGDNTYPNVMALLTGKLAEERPFGFIDRAPFLWKDFSSAGYRTLQVEDAFIENHVFNVWVDTFNSPGNFKSVPTDYYFRPLSVAMHVDHSLIDWRTKEYRMCTGPMLEDELILNWVRDVMQTVTAGSTSASNKRPIFAFSFFSGLLHEDMNDAAHMDKLLEQFFRSLHDSGSLTNTVVVLFSDHGIRYGQSRGNTRMAWYEENLPMALIAMPSSFRLGHVEMMKTLRSNRHRLTTPFDLHETLRRLVDIDSPYDDSRRVSDGRRGVSLFDVRLGDRTCKEASIAPTYCECQLSQSHPVDVRSTEVEKVASATVEYMNSQLSRYNGKCATLNLQSVLNAGMTSKTAAVTAKQHIYYTLTFQTTPGHGVFQAAVEWLGVEVKTDSDILRLNAYRQQAGCIQHIVHKKWCYCVAT